MTKVGLLAVGVADVEIDASREAGVDEGRGRVDFRAVGSLALGLDA